MPRLRLVTPTHPAAAPLMAGLRQEYHALYGSDAAVELAAHSGYEFFPPAGAFVVLESAGVTLAGGALRRFAPGVGEIKRMWTAPRHRRQGHSRRVLGALEAAAARRGYHTVRLQTGILQPAAVSLYESAGYAPTASWGRYVDDPRILSFEKRLDLWDHFAPDELDRGEIVVRQMLEHHALHAGFRQPL